jgi:hypothetical protein
MELQRFCEARRTQLAKTSAPAPPPGQPAMPTIVQARPSFRKVHRVHAVVVVQLCQEHGEAENTVRGGAGGFPRLGNPELHQGLLSFLLFQ